LSVKLVVSTTSVSPRSAARVTHVHADVPGEVLRLIEGNDPRLVPIS
jgi:hypothetical protein